MHEYSVTMGLIKMVVEEAKKVKAKKVDEIRLVIGDLSTIIDDSVQMYFDILSKDTLADGAKLVFKRVEAQFECTACGNIYNKPKIGFDCPVCGALGRPTGVGKEFYVESIEVEEDGSDGYT
jgi:Zn finger protein HypA/HybF (possibly regulating hydrogenase expression)